MLDERWSAEAEEIGTALRRILDKECTTIHVRQAEANADGRDAELERQLDSFGIRELPHSADILARVAYELGRVLAPVTFVETVPASVVLGVSDVSYGLEGDVPAAIPKVALRAKGGIAIVPLSGAARRTSAGDLLVRPTHTEAVALAGDDMAADRMRRLIRLVDSARLLGAAAVLLDIGVRYSKERVQSGKPIGAFQGVSHRLANAATALETAELLLRKAAFTGMPAVSGDVAPTPIFATMIRSKAIEASRFVATTVHQVMGGYGFTIDYDCQVYSRRIRSWTMRLDRPEGDLADLARALLDPTRRNHIRHLWHHDKGLPLPRWAAQADGKI